LRFRTKSAMAEILVSDFCADPPAAARERQKFYGQKRARTPAFWRRTAEKAKNQIPVDPL
jgi:hypothetical protein